MGLLRLTDYLAPFSCVRGNRQGKILVVGEAWGETEDKLGIPFAGAAGAELTRMQKDVGFPAHECLYTNLLNLRPPGNKFEEVLVAKSLAGQGANIPPVAQGKYLPESLLPHLARLWAEADAMRPNLILAMGAKALWAFTGASKIGQYRGAITYVSPDYRTRVAAVAPPVTVYSGWGKLLPTYHPAGVLRQWSWRPLVLGDLQKAMREYEFAELRRPKRVLLVRPTMEELVNWVDETLVMDPPWLSIDIETKARQITILGFARRIDQAMNVSFWGPFEGSFYENPADEIEARRQCKRLLESSIPKVFQNGLYDIQYLWREGLAPKNCVHDTMLLHHSLYPELPKGLGFLGAAYTNEIAWKLMRTEDTTKRDE